MREQTTKVVTGRKKGYGKFHVQKVWWNCNILVHCARVKVSFLLTLNTQRHLFPWHYKTPFHAQITSVSMNIAVYILNKIQTTVQWLSGRVLDLRPRVQASPASLCCGPWARHIYHSLVLVQPRKTRPCLTERLLMGCKESNQQTNKTCVKRPLKTDKTKILMTNGSLMKVLWSIIQYFWPALRDNWPWKSICGLFESGRFTQVLLYGVNFLAQNSRQCHLFQS